MTTRAATTFRTFVERINAHEPGDVVAMCTDDHVFTDSLGATLTGLDQLAAGWTGYFALFPDYRIDIQALAAADGVVLACGFAGATHAATGVAWRIPAAWRARIVRGRIAEWQVYADNKPVYELLGRGRGVDG